MTLIRDIVLPASFGVALSTVGFHWNMWQFWLLLIIFVTFGSLCRWVK